MIQCLFDMCIYFVWLAKNLIEQDSSMSKQSVHQLK